jgi:DNA (cytosine-5)-methyltransferase 1
MLCELRPAIALFENVPGLFISNGGKFFNRVLSDISSSGYDAEWQIISAYDVGAPHLRKRVWIVTYTESGRLSQNKQRKERTGKGCSEKPREWEPLLSLSTRDYTIQHWKDHEQILTGNYDGLPEELDAVKGIGNSVVPQCVEMILALPAFDWWRKV